MSESQEIQHEKCQNCLYNARLVKKRVYNCLNCDAQFSLPIKLANHVAIQHKKTMERPFDCKFEGCTKRFGSKETRSKHQTMTHRGWKGCVVQKKRVKKNKSKNNGNENTEVDNDSYDEESNTLKCPFCSKLFMCSYGLLEHVKGVHKTELEEIQTTHESSVETS